VSCIGQVWETLKYEIFFSYVQDKSLVTKSMGKQSSYIICRGHRCCCTVGLIHFHDFLEELCNIENFKIVVKLI